MTTIVRRAPFDPALKIAIRDYFITHPCCTIRDVAIAMGISTRVLNQYARSIRADWKSFQDGAEAYHQYPDHKNVKTKNTVQKL